MIGSPPLGLGDAPRSATQLALKIVEQLERRGDDEALTLPGRRLTGRECASDIRRFARALAASGVGAGDCVAVMLPNIAQFPIANVGSWLRGALYTPVNVMLRVEELSEVLEQSIPRVLICGHGTSEALRGPGGPPRLPEIVVQVGDDGPGGWDAFMARGNAQTDEFQASDVATLAFTSGTTSRPKGALIAADQIDLQEEVMSRYFGLGRGDVILQALPYFHSNASLAGVVLAWWLGARAAMVPRATAEWIDRAVREEAVTYGVGVATNLYDIARKGGDRVGWRTMRVFAFGGMPLGRGIREAFERVTGVRAVQGYGMTEAPGTAAFEHPNDERRPGYAGRALDHLRIVAVGESGDPLPAGEVGELALEPRREGAYAHRYAPITGYIDPEETARTLREGRFLTGDVGAVDPSQRVTLVDRLRDMITASGYKVSAAEVEHALRADPRISEAYVVAAPDARRGEIPVAFVVAAGEASLTPEDVVEVSRASLAAYKRLAGAAVVRAEDLPRNALGKVLKRELEAESALRGGGE